MKQLFILIKLQLFTTCIYSQTFLNGSFEINTVTSCMLNNINNAAFNSLMPDVKGIGLTETIDIFYDTDCPNFGYANTGHYYVSVENNSTDSTQSTILSLKLADTLQLSMSYGFCYYDKGFASIGTGPIEIGVSNTDSTFGNLIYTSPLIDTVWTKRIVYFNSPIKANYVTVRYGSINGGAVVDDFGTCNLTRINEKNSIKNIFQIYPNPTTDKINIQLTNDQKFNFNIYNSLGQIVKTGMLESGITTIYINDLKNGIYSIELSANNKMERAQFIVEKQSDR